MQGVAVATAAEREARMPQRKQPITEKPKVEDESTGSGASERHGVHRQEDEALPGSGGTKGGLDKTAGDGGRGTKQNEGLPQGDSHKSRGLEKDRS
jgi:hypothetical protein